MAAQLLAGIMAILITASLLDHGLLFTPLILNFPLCLFCIGTLVIIRSSEATNEDGHEGESPETLLSSIQRGVSVLFEILRSRNVLVLLATVPIAKSSTPIEELMLQYIPKRFGLSFAKVGLPFLQHGSRKSKCV